MRAFPHHSFLLSLTSFFDGCNGLSFPFAQEGIFVRFGCSEDRKCVLGSPMDGWNGEPKRRLMAILVSREMIKIIRNNSHHNHHRPTGYCSIVKDGGI